MVSPLHAKLGRDLWGMKGQALAIMVVIGIGVALQVMMSGFVASLTQTRDAYYDRTNFADIFTSVVRAPESSVADLASYPGVSSVATRLSSPGLIHVASRDLPVSAQFLSLPVDQQRSLNEVLLTSGRLPAPGQSQEILVLDSFATAQGLSPGDRLDVTLHGARRWLDIVGTAQSPEFIYFSAPGELIPDDARFGAIWMARPALAAALDLRGSFNEVLLKTTRDANLQAIQDHVDRTLSRFGTLGSYDRSEHPSNKFLSEEIAGLEVTSRNVPPIFMLVAAFLLYIVTSRMIQSEREEIGLMKAFGFTNREVSTHYLQLVLVIALAGAVLGCILGIVLGRLLVPIYVLYYKLPFLLFRLEYASFVTGVLTSVIVATLGGALVLRRIFGLTPADAMRPPAPPDYSRAGAVGRGVIGHFDQPTRMVLRRLFRQPWRMIGATVGIAAGMALSLAMLIIYEGFDEALDRTFNVIDRSDATVSFAGALSVQAMFNLQNLDNVTRVEPVRHAPVTFRNGHLEYSGQITGLAPDARLFRALDENAAAITMPARGVILSVPVAEILRVGVGDPVQIDFRGGAQISTVTRVAGIAESLLGAPAYMDLGALNRLMQEPDRITGAYLAITDGQESQVHKRLKDMPAIAGVSLRLEAERGFKDIMDQGAGSSRFVMGIMAFAITFGIIYNAARVARAERARDLASLRVMGFYRGETAFVLLGELAAVTLAALPLGMAIGTGLSRLIAAGFSTDLYQIPVVFAPKAQGTAILIVVGAALVSGWLVKRDLDADDMVASLKTRE